MMYLHIACVSLILFTIALLIGKQKKLSDYVLIAWLIIFLSNLATFFFIAGSPSNLAFWQNFLITFSDSSVFLHGPVFWFYTLSLSKPEFRFSRTDLLHFIPFIMVFILISTSILNYSGDMNTLVRALVLLKFASLLFYTIKIFLRLQAYRHSIKNIFSNTENKTLGWLRFLNMGIFVLWSVGFLTTILNWVSSYNDLKFDNYQFQVAVDIFIIIMSYFGFRQESLYEIKESNIYNTEEIRLLNSAPEEYIEVNGSTLEKYQKSGLSVNRAEDIHVQLLKVMENDQAFMDENLTLFKLAKMLGTTPNYLSQVINTMEQRNFFDFINFFRIEAIKQKINSKQFEHLTLLGIAFECGFNSKAAFNRAFKKFTGLTPTEFKRENSGR